jgi:glycopeptide antibiotics resistance protein
MRFDNPIRLLFWLALAAVIHLSLYPWSFRGWPRFDFPTIFWPTTAGDFVDCVANVFFYLPLGLFAFPGRAPWWRRLLLVPFGFLLSYFLEILQRESFGRVSSGTDILTNTLGTAVGAALSPLMARVLPYLRAGATVSGATIFLTVCFALGQAYPFISFLRLSKLRHLVNSARNPTLNFNEIGDGLWVALVLTMLWLSERGASLRNSFYVFLGLMGIMVWRGTISDLAFSTPMTLAVLIGFVVGLALIGTRFPLAWTIPLLLGFVWLALRGVWPLEWRDTPIAFQWSPLSGVLDLPRNGYIRVISWKLLLYGAWILAAIRAGIPAYASGAAAVALLFAIELMQRSIAGRTAETTDPFLAFIAALVLSSLERQWAKDRATAPVLDNASRPR